MNKLITISAVLMLFTAFAVKGESRECTEKVLNIHNQIVGEKVVLISVDCDNKQYTLDILHGSTFVGFSGDVTIQIGNPPNIFYNRTFSDMPNNASITCRGQGVNVDCIPS